MYPSISNNSNYSPICSSLFNIPSPSMQYEHDLFFEYYYHDHHVLQQPQALADDSTETDINNMADSNKLDALISGNELKEGGGCGNNKKGKRSNKNTSIPRNKRGYKKDRHSKINTAQGPRDRRIRLSIDIARNFFKLQDMLEFDKASKTVEWLLIKSKSAIMEHVNMSRQSGSNNVKDPNSASSVSECEVVSGIAECSPSNDHQKKKKNAKGISCNKEKKKKKKAKSVRRAAFHPAFTKESRKQAREKARERTELKKNFGEAMAHDIMNLRSWSEESGHNGMDHPSHEMRADVEELTSHHEEHLIGTKENIVNDCNWSPYAIFNYQQNAGILHEHQFTDFSFS